MSINVSMALLYLSFLVGVNLFHAHSRLLIDDPRLLNPSDKVNCERIEEMSRTSYGVSLVTSFWALREGDDSQSTSRGHRQEIEAAMLANLQNPHLQQLVVVLDSVSNQTIDCQGFVKYMTGRVESVSRLDSLHSSPETIRCEKAPRPELQCIERNASSGQPSYLEMFQYATLHPSITSEIVIMSNADQVFDDTVAYAAQIPNDTIFVLSTYGYATSRVPPGLRKQYQNFVGDDYNREAADRCHKGWTEGDSRKRHSNSWDSYVFQRSLLRNSFTLNDIDSELFKRLNFRREPRAYYMNELAAEYAALHDVTRDLDANVSVWNACKIIRSWHFHLAPKTHHGDGTDPQWPYLSSPWSGGYIFYNDFGPVIPKDSTKLVSDVTIANVPGPFVPPPYVSAPVCAGFASCYGMNQKSATLFHSPMWRDAPKVAAFR